MAPHSSTLAWKIPWTKEPGGLQSMGSLRVDRHCSLRSATGGTTAVRCNCRKLSAATKTSATSSEEESSESI